MSLRLVENSWSTSKNFLLWRAWTVVCVGCFVAGWLGSEPVRCFAQLPELQDEELAADGLARGWLQRTHSAEGTEWIRVVRQPLLTAAADLDPRANGESLQVEWSGWLESEAPGQYRFAVHGQGDFELRVNGEPALEGRHSRRQWSISEPLELGFDLHELELQWQGERATPQFAVYWQGPNFSWERLPAERLLHDLVETLDDSWARGRELVAGLRCAACHSLPGSQAEAFPAPELKLLHRKLRPEWLVQRLTAAGTKGAIPHAQAMPHYALPRDDAIAVAAYLFARSATREEQGETPAAAKPAAAKPAGTTAVANSDVEADVSGDSEGEERSRQVAAGARLAKTRGCLACHEVGSLGAGGLFAGGPLTTVADKRPSEFFAPWLADPTRWNAAHRMPRFDLDDAERTQLAAWLTSCTTSPQATHERLALPRQPDVLRRGEQLYQQLQCAACHEPEHAASRIELSEDEQLPGGCNGPPRPGKRPGYRLTASDAEAIEQYLQQPPQRQELPFETQLARRNCTGCHARGTRGGLAAQLPALFEQDTALAPLAAALHPPTLNGVGDKLKPTAIHDILQHGGNEHRPWLQVHMPVYDLTADERRALVTALTTRDRMPAGLQEPTVEVADELVDVFGPRLVTTSGFGCSSCHQIGSVTPPPGPLDARGPTLSGLGDRLHHDWFRRWVANPARFQPGMEMPSIQTPVAGVLDEELDRQLTAVWEILNRPDFEPPRPEPVRIARQTGAELQSRALVLTDVVRSRGATFTKPLVIGFPHRHNVLFDLETGGLAAWWSGDTLLQHTEGKSWFWEPGGAMLYRESSPVPDFALRFGPVNARQLVLPERHGQFVTELESWQHQAGGLRFRYRLKFSIADQAREVMLTEQWLPDFADRAQTPEGREGHSGWQRTVRVSGLQPGEELVYIGLQKLADRRLAAAAERQVTFQNPQTCRVEVLQPPAATFSDELHVALSARAAQAGEGFGLRYWTPLPTDRVLRAVSDAEPAVPRELDVVPGFRAIELPLAVDWMPTGMDWGPTGELFVTSLKGRVWRVTDHDGDGWEDQAQVFSDELAAPFGIAAHEAGVDVVNKFALLRLSDEDGDGFAERSIRLASGWGHTTDYHDWAVGLPRDASGAYYIALACQQDERSSAAARYRGEVLRLAPTAAGTYRIEPLSRGHRFPIGIALSAEQGLFVTDNQGNYTPFNELNRVVPGRHFGFINRLDREEAGNIEVTNAAIKIPHPWTRSVNGIGWLDGDVGGVSVDEQRFGPFTGHLIGCEYDTRRLVRMSLEEVEGEMQGAVYPFSWNRSPGGAPLLGPLACRVSPSGDLYVGNIRDSGWGGANNIGSLVRLRFVPAQLPAGLAEIRALPDGFELQMTRPVVPSRAAQRENYQISSYRRVRTPSYGGPDVDRRREVDFEVELTEQADVVRLKFAELRPGFVYEFKLRPLVDEQETFFPAEAFYSLNRVPESVAR